MGKDNKIICAKTHKIAKPHIDHFRTAIDVGCKFGEYSRLLTDDFKKIECFEPRFSDAEVAKKKCKQWFWRNVNKIKCQKKVRLYSCALGDIEADVFLSGNAIIRDENWYKTHLRAHPLAKWTPIKQKTLDSFDFKDVDFIKIDVEGHELQVLKGTVKTLNTYKPVIVLEQNDLAEKWGKGNKFDGVNFLKTLGYEQVDFDGKMDYVMKYKGNA